MENGCDRCGRKAEKAHFIFYEVDQRDRKHRLGIFCIQCTIELLDELKGKLEWFHIGESWKGYVHPEARSELEKTGFIHPKHNSKYIEITQVERKGKEVRRKEALEILRVEYAGGLISKEEYRRRLREF